MALLVNASFLVLLNFVMILFHEVYYGFGIETPSGVNHANLVPLAKYSFVVLVNVTKKHTYCTGALISRKFVLSVAHCVSEETDTSVRVIRGNIEPIHIEHIMNTTINTIEQVTRKGNEERQSVGIFQPWLYTKSENEFDVALIEVYPAFESHSFVKTTLLTPFIKYNVPTECNIVGYDVDVKLYPDYRRTNKLTEYTLLIQKLCENEHKTDGTCSGTAWIVQEDERYIDRTFANSGALLLCSGKTPEKTHLNGMAIGYIKVASSETPNRTKHQLMVPDICPYLSWIRSYVGNSIIRSPGHYGKGCFYRGSSFRTQSKSVMAWFVVIVCMLLYL